MLLPQPKEITESLPNTVADVVTLGNLVVDVDLDKLQLRLARKIAKALGIAQKVNGKDQPLSWLRTQIKAKLQQP